MKFGIYSSIADPPAGENIAACIQEALEEARLAEECGEVASQVSHFESKGVKTMKLGSPDRAAFAKELQDVMRAVVQLATHYRLEAELEASVDRSYQEIVIEGLVDPVPEEPEGRKD